MPDSSVLTIAFPTFNRCEAITERVQELYSTPLSADFSVLVVDNHSSDATWAKLLELKNCFPDLRISRNDQNLGFAGNFFRLFEECSSEYLMVMSDEDAVIVDQLPAYMRFLRDSDAALVSPQAVVFDRIYRGRLKCEGILPDEFRDASYYISGCTFHTERSKALAPRITSVIGSNSAAHVYPQVLLSGELLLDHGGVWYPHPLSSKRQQLESHIFDLDGSFYGDPSSRCRQTLDLLSYLDDLEEGASGSSGRSDGAHMMKNRAGADFFHQLRSSLRGENIELADAFDSQARKFYRRGPRMKMLLGLAVRNPLMVVSALRKRIFKFAGTEDG